MIPLLRLLTLAILCTWVVSQDEYPRLELVYETKELARGQAVGLCYTLDGAQLVTVSRHDGVIVRDADELKVLHRFSPRDNDKIRYDTTLLYASTADSGIALLHDGRVSIWNNDGSLRETRTSKYTDRRMPVFARRSPTSFVVIRELRKATPEAESSERSILHVRRDEGWRTFDVTDLGPLRSMVIDDLAARIAVAGERVWILDIENGTVERSVAHDDVTQLCWLRDGSLWGLVAGQLTCLTRVRRHDEIRGSNLVAAVDGLHLAAVGAREIVTTDGQGRTVHRLPRRPVPVLCVAARNGREVAVSYSDGVVVVHRPRGEHTMADFTAVVCSLSFSRDSRHLAVASHELIRFMTLPAGAMRLAVEPRGFPAICPGRLGGEMIVIDATGAHIYDAKAAQRSATFEVEVPPVEHAVVSLSPTDRELAIGSPAGRAYIVDLVNGRVAMLKSSFNDAAWSSDGTQLAAVFGNVGVVGQLTPAFTPFSLEVFSREGASVSRFGPDGLPLSVAWQPGTGRQLLSLGPGHSSKYDLETSKVEGDVLKIRGASWIRFLSPSLAVLHTRHDILLLSWPQQEVLHQVLGGKRRLFHPRVSPDNRYIAVSLDQKRVQLFEVVTEK